MTDLQLAWLLIAVGFIGAIVPLLPGPPLVFAGATYYAWKTDWAEVSPLTIVVLALLAVVGSTADIWVSGAGAKKGGASGWATLASMVGGLIGFLVGSLPGLFLGAIGAIVLVEYSRHKDWNKVVRASGGYLAGYLLSLVVQLFVCAVMAAIFWAAVKW